jgi:hypothetical protein
MIHDLQLIARHLVPQEVLGWNGDYQFQLLIGQHALASEARVDARANGPVNEVFFLVRNLGQVVHALVDVDVAGATAAHAAAVVLQLNTVVEGYIEHRLAAGGHVRLGGLAVLKLKKYSGGLQNEEGPKSQLKVQS